MTNPEFAEWLRHAKTRFPQVRRMLDDMPISEQGDTQIFWFERLKPFDAATADAALDTLFESSKRLFAADWFAAYVGTIRGVSSERKREARRYDGEPLNDCRYGCGEDGMVFIVGRCPKSIRYHAKVLFGMKDGDDVPDDVAEDIARRFPVAVACACKKGERMAGNGLRRFNPTRDELHGRSQPQPATTWKTQGDV